MAPSKNNCYKRRSLYGNCQSLSTTIPNKSFRASVRDRVIYKHKSFADEGNKTYHPDSLILITQHNWNLYRISHLSKLKYNTVKLKQYGASIRNALIKSINDTHNDHTFSVKFELLPEFEESEEHSHSLQIDVFCKKNDTEPVLKYRALILSWDSSNNSDILTQLPLLLCVGTINIIRIVHKALSNLFDTQLFPLQISEDDLMWLSAMLSDSDRKNTVTYDFSIHGSTIKSPMLFSLPCRLIKELWNEIHFPDSEEIKYDEVQSFHKLLQDQLKTNYGINFKLLKLNKILMSDATIACEGKMKIFTEEAAVKVISFINEVSLLLDSSNPNMFNIEINDNSL